MFNVKCILYTDDVYIQSITIFRGFVPKNISLSYSSSRLGITELLLVFFSIWHNQINRMRAETVVLTVNAC